MDIKDMTEEELKEAKRKAIQSYKPKEGEKIIGYTEDYIKVMDKKGKIKYRRPKKTEIEQKEYDQREKLPYAQMTKIEDDEKKRSHMAKVLRNCYSFFKIGRKEVKNNDELCERLDYYFNQCADTQQLPTIEKMALCLGLTTQGLANLINDNGPRWVTPETQSILQKAKQTIAAMDAELVEEGKIQPVVYMFRAKNYYGMRDQQEIIVSSGAENTYNPAELAEEARLLAENDAKAERKKQSAIIVDPIED